MRLRKVAGALVRRQRQGKRSDLRLGRRQRRGDGEEPRHHALDIAVDGRRPRAEGDGGDCRGGIVADAWQRAELGLGRREAPAMALDHLPRAGVQVAGAGVIAKPGPGGEHLAKLGGGKRAHIGQRRRKSA